MVIKEQNPLWLCDHLQYVRMLSELLAAGIPTNVCKDLQKSMDLTENEVFEIFNRAEVEWDGIKITAPKSFNPKHHLLYLESKWVLVNHEAYKAIQRENDELRKDNRGLADALQVIRGALAIVDSDDV